MRSSLFDDRTPAGRLMARTDWAASPIGHPDGWPQSLRGLVRTVLSSRYPMLLLWGEQFTQIYNDAYSALIGDRHPAAMGEDCRVTLADAWPVLGPLIEEAMVSGVASWVPALQLLLNRSGYREESYFSVSHAPAVDDHGVTRGVLTVCSEVTDQVVGQRRLQLLRQLSVTGAGPSSVQASAEQLVAGVAESPLDVPFLGLYLSDGTGQRRAAGSTPALPAHVATVQPDSWGLSAAGGGDAVVIEVPDGGRIPGGAFGDQVTQALALPIPSGDRAQPLGALVAAISPSRVLDESYRSFFDLLAQQVGATLRNARSHEQERARAEALAELDRAKTEFFTNVSHEFRTPLTLMLGPLQDALGDGTAPLPAAQRERVEIALRGSHRMLKLVNNLLTVASVEAGRSVVAIRPVDLAELTADLASEFRAAVERGGLTLEVDCPPLPGPVVLDAEHWEQIVTNLLSNALKFTFVGGIALRLRGGADGIDLEVEDTGIGIGPDDLPQLFDRFQRVHVARSRSHEGTGIGLALVRELATLHGGRVEVASVVGAGTCFTVRLPWQSTAVASGDASAGRVSATPGAAARAAVEEAMSWTASEVEQTETAHASPDVEADALRVLVADDNADMRAHLIRLLAAQGWLVHAVADGQTALDLALSDPPDLLLTDVMMPGAGGGFGLVRSLRADPRTAALPIVVLSARAGAGASAEGLDLGADDYVVKPFESADLVARLRSVLRMAKLRSHPGRPAALRPATDPADPRPPEMITPTPTHRSVQEPAMGQLADVDVEFVLARSVQASAQARHRIRPLFEQAGVDPATVSDLLVALSEAVNNAIEHAVDPTLDEVLVSARIDGAQRRVSLTIRDYGQWRERRPSMDRGHGSALMTAIVGHVQVIPGPTGTVVCLERDL